MGLVVFREYPSLFNIFSFYPPHYTGSLRLVRELGFDALFLHFGYCTCVTRGPWSGPLYIRVALPVRHHIILGLLVDLSVGCPIDSHCNITISFKLLYPFSIHPITPVLCLCAWTVSQIWCTASAFARMHHDCAKILITQVLFTSRSSLVYLLDIHTLIMDSPSKGDSP